MGATGPQFSVEISDNPTRLAAIIPTLKRLWKERRTMQTVLVGAGAWGEFWVSMLPLARWAKRRVAATRSAMREARHSHSG